MSNKKNQYPRMVNRVLLLLLLAVVVLVAVIAVTSLQGEQRERPAQPSAQPESTGPLQSQSSTPSSAPSTSSTPSPGSASSTSSQPSPAASSQGTQPKPDAAQPLYYEEGKPLLVNPTNKVPAGYTPDVVLMDNGKYNYDRTANIAYNAMLKAASADGISLWVVSAYRNHDRQTTNFNNMVKQYENAGQTAQQAYATTAQIIAVPGTSEHELGLALDLNSLETSFEETKAFRWLVEHCAEYGFILRYPKDKVEITQITYEPWHYRYVGSNHAKIIMEKAICLEEYLSGTYQ